MDNNSTAVLRVSPMAGAAEEVVALFGEMDIVGLDIILGRRWCFGWGIRRRGL